MKPFFLPNPKPVTSLFESHLKMLIEPPKAGTDAFSERKATFFAACISMLEHLKETFPITHKVPNFKERKALQGCLQKIYDDCLKELESLVEAK